MFKNELCARTWRLRPRDGLDTLTSQKEVDTLPIVILVSYNFILIMWCKSSAISYKPF